MIVIGADTHKATHTCAAVARKPGFTRLLAWGRELGVRTASVLEGPDGLSGVHNVCGRVI